MGRLIIEYAQGRLAKKPGNDSFKCKSEERAKEIVKKRKNVKDWHFSPK